MYQAIVFLPLLGAIIAGLIALAGARARFPGATPGSGAHDHAHGSPAAGHGAPPGGLGARPPPPPAAA